MAQSSTQQFLLSLHKLDETTVDAAYDQTHVVIDATDKQEAFRLAHQIEAEIGDDDNWVVTVTTITASMSQTGARKALVAAATQAND